MMIDSNNIIQFFDLPKDILRKILNFIIFKERLTYAVINKNFYFLCHHDLRLHNNFKNYGITNKVRCLFLHDLDDSERLNEFFDKIYQLYNNLSFEINKYFFFNEIDILVEEYRKNNNIYKYLKILRAYISMFIREYFKQITEYKKFINIIYCSGSCTDFIPYEEKYDYVDDIKIIHLFPGSFKDLKKSYENDDINDEKSNITDSVSDIYVRFLMLKEDFSNHFFVAHWYMLEEVEIYNKIEIINSSINAYNLYFYLILLINESDDSKKFVVLADNIMKYQNNVKYKKLYIYYEKIIDFFYLSFKEKLINIEHIEEFGDACISEDYRYRKIFFEKNNIFIDYDLSEFILDKIIGISFDNFIKLAYKKSFFFILYCYTIEIINGVIKGDAIFKILDIYFDNFISIILYSYNNIICVLNNRKISEDIIKKYIYPDIIRNIENYIIMTKKRFLVDSCYSDIDFDISVKIDFNVLYISNKDKNENYNLKISCLKEIDFYIDCNNFIVNDDVLEKQKQYFIQSIKDNQDFLYLQDLNHDLLCSFFQELLKAVTCSYDYSDLFNKIKIINELYNNRLIDDYLNLLSNFFKIFFESMQVRSKNNYFLTYSNIILIKIEINKFFSEKIYANFSFIFDLLKNELNKTSSNLLKTRLEDFRFNKRVAELAMMDCNKKPSLKIDFSLYYENLDFFGYNERTGRFRKEPVKYNISLLRDTIFFVPNFYSLYYKMLNEQEKEEIAICSIESFNMFLWLHKFLNCNNDKREVMDRFSSKGCAFLIPLTGVSTREELLFSIRKLKNILHCFFSRNKSLCNLESLLKNINCSFNLIIACLKKYCANNVNENSIFFALACIKYLMVSQGIDITKCPDNLLNILSELKFIPEKSAKYKENHIISYIFLNENIENKKEIANINYRNLVFYYGLHTIHFIIYNDFSINNIISAINNYFSAIEETQNSCGQSPLNIETTINNFELLMREKYPARFSHFVEYKDCLKLSRNLFMDEVVSLSSSYWRDPDPERIWSYLTVLKSSISTESKKRIAEINLSENSWFNNNSSKQEEIKEQNNGNSKKAKKF